MKKVLALLLMMSIAQGLLAERQPTQYKYLNRLHTDSQIRKQCEQVDRESVKGRLQSACDLIDYSFIKTASDLSFFAKNGEKISQDELLNWPHQVGRIRMAFAALNVLDSDRQLKDDEGSYIDSLVFDIANEEYKDLIQDLTRKC
ncbi:MAG TPA: hypothetical protein VKU36_06145 [Candidatus Babeliales bacterium]|nr:hypothetical protein [Candidatus Babeliales bacterium]